jgi:hypothetical protein
MKFQSYKYLLASLVICLLTFIISSQLCASQHIYTISSPREALSFEKKSDYEKTADYDVVKLFGAHLMNEIGEPALPVKNIYVAMPNNVQVVNVEIISAEVQELSGRYRIYPAQTPVPLTESANIGPFVSPKVDLYDSSMPYPKDIIEYVGTGWLGGLRIAMLRVYPVQYIPSEGILKFYDRIEFNLITKVDEQPKPVVTRTLNAQWTYDEICKDLVINPQEIGGSKNYKAPTGEFFEYLIITNDQLAPSFQPLADWKTQKGIPAVIRTTSWISSVYSGRDLQEKIRNYLKIAYQDSGLVWVLLGGDTQIVPCRYAKIELESYPEDIPSDLYYSDLDGSWDFDGDSFYGEPEDSLDIFPDVFIGRAPATTVQQAQRFVNKVLTYSKTPTLGYQRRGLFFAEFMDARTDEGIAKDMIIDRYIPENFDQVIRLYASLGNLNAGAVVSYLNQGFNIANHCGHANEYLLSTGSDYVTSSSFDNLGNSPKFTGILYSIGCWPAALDYDCIAEHFVNSANGGGFFIGNSRYGWFTPSFPGYGSSDLFDQEFFSEVFLKLKPQLGVALAGSKLRYAADAQRVNDYRWVCFELNLLGDPEMGLWTDTPANLTVDYPDTLVIGESELLVSVMGNSQPVKDALVCVSKGGEVYKSGMTGADGQVRLKILPTSTGTLSIVVTASNFLPYQGSAVVESDRPSITPCGYVIYDSVGNNDGIVNPGERIGMWLKLTNLGSQTANGVACSLSTSSVLVDSIGNAQIYYGNIAPGDTVVTGEFYFQVSSMAQDRDIIYFDLHVTDNGGFSWDPQVAVTVGAPVLVYLKTNLDDGLGGDGMPDPNETINLWLTIKNTGLGNSNETYGILSTNDPYITILSDSSWFGDLGPADSANSVIPYRFAISGVCPNQHIAWLSLTLVGEDYSTVDSFRLYVGDVGFFDDVENGEGGWAHSGTTDQWHISAHRSHSEGHSWYCGNEGSWLYSRDFTAYLVSPPIVLADFARLSFWTWHYIESGWDYAFCEINKGDGWRELGMLTGQSGGWVQKTYDLSDYAGDVVQIRFSFLSDDDDFQFEGWYIDDIEVTPRKSEFICGDCNGDGVVELSDVVYLISYLYRGGPAPIPYPSGNLNGDSIINLGDLVYLINYLYKSGPPPCP